MPLTGFTQSLESLNSAIYKAKGSNGESIVVGVSQRALQDYGESRVWQKASDKYDAGKIAGSTVMVRTYDFV